MITRRKTVAVWLIGLIAAMTPALALAKNSSTVARFDTDHDGTVSLDEAKKAAETVFDKLDRDHDGTLTRRELRGRLSARQFVAADTDKDGTISKNISPSSKSGSRERTPTTMAP
jgi:hypothetical protein